MATYMYIEQISFIDALFAMHTGADRNLFGEGVANTEYHFKQRNSIGTSFSGGGGGLLDLLIPV